MPLFSISAYYFRVKEKYKKGTCILDDFDSGQDLYDTFFQFFSRLKLQVSHDQYTRRIIQVTKLRRDQEQRIIEGIVRTGEYGYEADLIDAPTNNVSYHRKTTEAEVFPFYFLASLPEGGDLGTLLLQRFRQFGIRRALSQYLDEFFVEKHEHFSLSVAPVLTPEVLKVLQDEGNVHAIHVIKYTLPQDKADALSVPKEEVSADYVIRTKAHRTNIFADLKDRMLRGRNFRIAALEELMPDFDTVKIEVDLGGEKRSVDLSKPKLRTTIDLTDRVPAERNGHPSFENMSREARTILRGLDRNLNRG